MRNFVAIILLYVFTMAQYAKQVSYWECKVSNAFRGANQKCDCEKLIRETKPGQDPFSVPARHDHIHSEDLYDLSKAPFPSIYESSTINYYIAGSSMISTDWITRVDRPPRLD